MKNKTYIQPQSICYIMNMEHFVANSPTLGINQEEVTDLENDAATNRKGFAGGMWDYMQ